MLVLSGEIDDLCASALAAALALDPSPVSSVDLGNVSSITDAGLRALSPAHPVMKRWIEVK